MAQDPATPGAPGGLLVLPPAAGGPGPQDGVAPLQPRDRAEGAREIGGGRADPAAGGGDPRRWNAAGAERGRQGPGEPGRGCSTASAGWGRRERRRGEREQGGPVKARRGLSRW